AMIDRHRHAARRLGRRRAFAAVAHALRHEAGFVEKLIAFEYALFVPARAAEAEIEAQPLLAELAALRRPLAQRRLQRGDRLGPAAAPVLPREIAIPALPRRIGRLPRRARRGGPRLAHQREIAERQRALRRLAVGLAAVAVAERIELFDIAQRLMGLPLDPGAQAGFERAVPRLERSRRQGVGAVRRAHHENARLL